MITFKLKPDSGDEFEVEATTRDVLMWEKTTKGASFGQFADEASLKLADLYKVAWLASKRQSLITADMPLKEFEDSHDLDFDMGEEPDPTRSAR